MITITCKNNVKFSYYGNIDLSINSEFIKIDATSYESDDNDKLFIWDRKVWDVIWNEDIISIIGIDNEPRSNSKTNPFS